MKCPIVHYYGTSAGAFLMVMAVVVIACFAGENYTTMHRLDNPGNSSTQNMGWTVSWD